MTTTVARESLARQGSAVVGQLAARRWFVGEDTQRGCLALLDQVLVSGLSFVTSALIASHCGRSALGVTHLALTAYYLWLNVQGELVNAPYTIYRRGKEGRWLPSYSGSVLAHQAALTLVWMMVVAGLLSIASLGWAPRELQQPLALLLCVGPFCLLHGFLRHFCFAAFRFRFAVALDVLAAVLQLSVLFIIAHCGGLSVPVVLLTMGGASAAACLAWVAWNPEPVRLVWNRLWPDWCENWTFGRWALASHLVGCAGTYCLPWLLALVHNEAATGALAGAGKVSALAATFVVGIAHYLTPRAAEAFGRGGVAALKRVLWGTGVLFALSVGLFCGFVWVFGDALLVLLFGDEFAGMGTIVTLLSVAVWLNSLAVVGGNGLWAIRQPQAALISDTAALIATLIAAVALVGSWGVLGIAVATVAGGAIGAVLRGFTLVVLLRRLAAQEAKQ